jgi:hypothetical protein
MSRFIRKAGSGGGGGASYGDANVCSLLQNYTGTLSASDGYNICNLRSGWERVYYDCGLNGALGTICLANLDTSKYDAFCISIRGLCGTCTTSGMWTSLGTSTCFCICTGSACYVKILSSYGLCNYICQSCAYCAGGCRCVSNMSFNYALLVEKNYSGLRVCEYTQGCMATADWLPRSIWVPSLNWSNFAKVGVNGCCICLKCASVEVLGAPSNGEIL